MTPSSLNPRPWVREFCALLAAPIALGKDCLYLYEFIQELER